MGGRQQKAPAAGGSGRGWFSSGVGGQPGGQVGRAREVEQGVGQGFQLLQGQRLDLGGGGVCEGAAAAVELAEGHGHFALLAAFLAAFLAALGQPVLHQPGVAHLLAGDLGDLHQLILAVLRKALPQHRKHNRAQIRSPGHNLAAVGRQFRLRADRQREQVEQRIEIRLLAELLEADPVHLLQHRPQQSGRIGWPQRQAVVGRDHHHLQVLQPGVTLHKAQALGRKPPVEAGIGVHLHLKEHHRELGAAGFGAAGALPGPEHAVEAVAQFFELEGQKAVVAIAGGCRVEAQRVGVGGG